MRGWVVGAAALATIGGCARRPDVPLFTGEPYLAVWMYPGATALARTPRDASSRASDFVKPMIPAFDAA